MYLVGEGHEHQGPGTSLVQMIDWTADKEMQLNDSVRPQFLGMGGGLGCCLEMADDRAVMTQYMGLGCNCRSGLGLFDAGMDFSTWGVPEWAIVGLGAYALASMVFTTKRAARRVAALPGERRKRLAADYRKRAAELSRR